MAGLRFQVLEDERVLISFVGMSPASMRVTASEARRFAYGLLADLEPLKAEPQVYRTPKPPAPIIEERREKILRALKAGETSSMGISRATGIKYDNTYTALAALRRQGLVDVDQSNPNVYGWFLTAEGLIAAEKA